MKEKKYANVVDHLCGSGEKICDNLSAVTCPYITEVLTGKEITIETLRKFPFIRRVRKDVDGTYVIIDCICYKVAKKGQNELQKEALLNQGKNDIMVTGFSRTYQGRCLTKKIDGIISNSSR